MQVIELDQSYCDRYLIIAFDPGFYNWGYSIIDAMVINDQLYMDIAETGHVSLVNKIKDTFTNIPLKGIELLHQEILKKLCSILHYNPYDANYRTLLDVKLVMGVENCFMDSRLAALSGMVVGRFMDLCQNRITYITPSAWRKSVGFTRYCSLKAPGTELKRTSIMMARILENCTNNEHSLIRNDHIADSVCLGMAVIKLYINNEQAYINFINNIHHKYDEQQQQQQCQ